LQQKAARHRCLVFCIGENGLDLARQLGIPADCLVKTANWLGPLLVEAGIQKVESVLLFGYHGKLIKLAGGIFHTHHHVADGRIEILTAQCAKAGLAIAHLQKILTSETAEAGLQYLRELERDEGRDWVQEIYRTIALTIDQRAQQYIYAHCEQTVTVGSILFGRDRQIIAKSASGSHLFEQVLIT
jgi:cobalt-precorrin-5B (C1)-methyltransferase